MRQQDRLGKASRDERGGKKNKKQKNFYHIEVAVLCPVQKNWLSFQIIRVKNIHEVILHGEGGHKLEMRSCLFTGHAGLFAFS